MATLSIMELVIAVKRITLFSNVCGEGLKRLADVVREKAVTAGEVVFAENDLGDEMYLVHRGAVDLFQTFGDRDASIGEVTVGGYFGELAVIDDLPRSASARVRKDGLLLVLNKKDFRSAVQDYPDIALEVLREVSRRLRAADERTKSLVAEREERKRVEAT